MTDRIDQQWQPREVARLLALVEGERRYYQEMMAGLPVPLAILGYDRELIYANRAFRSIFGLTANDLRRKSILEILPGTALEEALAEVETKRSIDPVILSDGQRTVRVSLLLVNQWDASSDHEIVLVAENLTDIMPGLHPEPAAVQQISSDFDVVLWEADPATLQFRSVWGDPVGMFGYAAEDWTTRANFFAERISVEDRESVLGLYRDAVARGVSATAEFSSQSVSGGRVWCRETVRLGRLGDTAILRGVLTNLTDRKPAEKQLLTAGRQEALREIAGKLAHSLNNPLMIVSGYQEELMSTPGIAHADWDEMAAATKRIAEIAHRLSEFVKPAAQDVEPIDLGQLLGSMGGELARLAGAGTTVELNTAEKAVALANRAQLMGAILALSAATREGAIDRNRVLLTTGVQTVNVRLESGLTPGVYACLRIEDDGRGLDEKRRASLFENIVPEKAGTSGWAVQRAYALVREWGGDIFAESAPGLGMQLTLLLPHAPQVEAREPELEQPAIASVSPSVPETASIPPTSLPIPPEPSRETILVVDDESGIRGLVRKILRRERYQVLEAGSAEEALQIARTHTGTIDLLLTDVMMPGQNGPDLARQMYERSPNLKVLYISGFSPEETARKAQFPPGAQFLAKPFTLGALVSSVRWTLDAKA